MTLKNKDIPNPPCIGCICFPICAHVPAIKSLMECYLLSDYIKSLKEHQHPIVVLNDLISKKIFLREWKNEKTWNYGKPMSWMHLYSYMHFKITSRYIYHMQYYERTFKSSLYLFLSFWIKSHYSFMYERRKNFPHKVCQS